MAGSILTLNAGSSSLKFALFDEALAPVLRGEIEDTEGTPHLVARDVAGNVLAERRWSAAHASSAIILGDFLDIMHCPSSEHLAQSGSRISGGLASSGV
jgi:acetate kinase